MLSKFILVIIISQVAYGGGTGVGVSTHSVTLPFKSEEACKKHAADLAKKITNDTGVRASVSCSYAGPH